MACTGDTALTGRLGKVVVDDVLVARTTSWSINESLSSTAEWGDSDSQGYTNRVPGRRDASMDVEGKYDQVHEVFDIFAVGDKAEVFLHQNLTVYWAFPCALCTEFSIEVDIDGEDVIGWTSSWMADGIYYRPGQAGAPASSLPDPPYYVN